MPPRKRKVPEKTTDEVVEENPVESSNGSKDKPGRKRRMQKNKQKSNEVETVSVDQATTEKHVVIKILINAQTNEAFHSKYIKELTNQYAKIGHDTFLAMFICCLKQLIDKEEAVASYANVGLQFMAKFAASLSKDESEDMHKFLEDVFHWVLKTVSLSHNVRSRLCRFVNILLDSLGSNASLDDNLFDSILKYMFDRLKDMYPSVRVQAIKALQRLQMPDDPDDPIVKIYTFHLASDPSGPVRQAVLTCLGRNIHTIPVILERLWDIDEKVRRHVYVHMANYPVKTYKVIHRLTFLEQGLNDRSDSVRRVVTGIMIPQWLESYNKNYLAFLSGLKLDASDAEIDRFRSIACLALSEIFKTQKPDDLINALSLDDAENSAYPKCIPFEKLTVESSLFWCSLIAYFQQDERRADYLELVVPELSTFCGYVEKYNDTIIAEEKEPWEIIISQGILFNLIEILINFDHGDEIGRQRLRSLAVHLLTSNPCNENIIKSLINICEKLIPNSDDRLQVYVDVIRSLVDQDLVEKSLNLMDSNVVESMERDPDLKVQVSSLKLKLYELKEEESKFSKMKDYASVSRIAEEISLCQDRLVTLIRPLMASGSNSLPQKRITKELQIKALKLAFHGVCSKMVTKLNPAMCQLYTDFIRLKIESSDMDVRNWALKCGATFSLLYEQLAKDVFTALNKQFFDHHHTDVWTTSVGAMFQLIDRYGFSYFDEDPNSESGEKQNEKRKKSRLLYNTTEYADDPEDEGNIEKGNVTIKGLIYLFGHFMDTCDDIHLMSALIDGFGLLILHGLYVDEKLVSRLILLYFNPTTEAEVNQILSIFFETLIHQKKQECLEAALIQTLTKIIEASSESALHEIKVETVLRFIISSTMPIFCKTGAKIHDNIALSLLKWMTNNASNRDVLKVTSKEILSLDISDDATVRQTTQGYVNELLELPMDLKTEKNLKLFKEKMQGYSPPDIQFSSVAPATGIDGELDLDQLQNDDDQAQSDVDSSNKNDEDAESTSDDVEKTTNKENADDDKRSETPDDGESESNDSVAETPVQSENVDRTSNTRSLAGETTPSKEPATNNAEPADQSHGDSNEDASEDESQPQQLVLQVDVHSVPVNSDDSVSPSPSKLMRKRVRRLVTEQRSKSSAIEASPIGLPAPKKKKPIVSPLKTIASPVSEPIKSLKRRSDTIKSSKGDTDAIQPSKKKSRSENFSETSKEDAQKSNTAKSKNITANEKREPVVRSTRRSRTAEVTRSADKKTSPTKVQQTKQSKATTAAPKRTISTTPTRSKNKIDQTEKSNTKQKSNESTNSSKKKSDPPSPAKAARRTRTSLQNVDEKSAHISSRKTTPNKTPQPTITEKKATRQRLIASAPSTQAPKSKIGLKHAVSSKTRNDTTSKGRSSLSNLETTTGLDMPQHRTRRALAKEFMVNNVVTRNRSSIDGLQLLEKLPTARRKSVVSIGQTEKVTSTGKSKKKVDDTPSIPLRSRRVKS